MFFDRERKIRNQIAGRGKKERKREREKEEKRKKTAKNRDENYNSKQKFVVNVLSQQDCSSICHWHREKRSKHHKYWKERERET